MSVFIQGNQCHRADMGLVSFLLAKSMEAAILYPRNNHSDPWSRTYSLGVPPEPTRTVDPLFFAALDILAQKFDKSLCFMSIISSHKCSLVGCHAGTLSSQACALIKHKQKCENLNRIIWRLHIYIKRNWRVDKRSQSNLLFRNCVIMTGQFVLLVFI